MKKFEINVDINGTITFEVQAKNRKDAQKQVDDILSNKPSLSTEIKNELLLIHLFTQPVFIKPLLCSMYCAR